MADKGARAEKCTHVPQGWLISLWCSFSEDTHCSLSLTHRRSFAPALVPYSLSLYTLLIIHTPSNAFFLPSRDSEFGATAPNFHSTHQAPFDTCSLIRETQRVSRPIHHHGFRTGYLDSPTASGHRLLSQTVHFASFRSARHQDAASHERRQAAAVHRPRHFTTVVELDGGFVHAATTR